MCVRSGDVTNTPICNVVFCYGIHDITDLAGQDDVFDASI